MFYIQTDLGQQLQNTIEFNISDPFPWLEPDSYTYEAAKTHAVAVDLWLGLPTEETPSHEKTDRKNLTPTDAQTWQHLSPQQFQTPYCEIRNILEDLKLQPDQTLVDLGCGYGRVGFVMNRHFPKTFFHGFEIVENRVSTTQAIINARKFQNFQIERADITAPDFQIPVADFYFIFDFGSNAGIQKILNGLKDIARTKSIRVVGRGRATRHYIQTEHPWLSQVIDPQHRAHYSIYKS